MFIFANKSTGEFLGTSGLATTITNTGNSLSIVDEESALINAEKNFSLPRSELVWTRITDLNEAERISAKPAAMHKAIITDGKLEGVEDDPGYVPPTPPMTPQQQVEAIMGALNGNLLASEHDKRWLAQKETAKSEGIPWIKAHPAATQAEFETAMVAALGAEHPNDPIVISPAGVIASYAKGAKDRGLIADATFNALRDLVVSTPDKQLQKLLARL